MVSTYHPFSPFYPLYCVSPSSSEGSEGNLSYASDMSTPFKSGVISVQHHDTTTMKRFLRLDTHGHLYQQPSIRDFVTKVWGLEERTWDLVVGDELLRPPMDYINDYQRAAANHSAHESTLYEPLSRIVHGALQDVCTVLGKSSSGLKTEIWHGGGNTYFTSEYTGRKPDMIIGWKPIPTPVAWDVTKIPVEIKKHGSKHTEGLGILSPSAAPLENMLVLPNETSAHRLAVGQYHAASEGSPSIPLAARPEPLTGTKRHDDDDLGQGHKRRRMDLTGDELQLGLYVLECFAGSKWPRHFVTGILVEGTSVSFWYFDRVGAFQSSLQFDASAQHFRAFSLALYALDQASINHSGFDPHVYEFIRPSPTIPLSRSCLKQLQAPPPDADDKLLCFHFPNTNYVFEICEILRKYRAIIGRGTYVAAVRMYEMGSPIYRDRCILKMAWQYEGRNSEAAILISLRNTLPAYKRYLPDPFFSTEFTSADINIPRSCMQLSSLDSSQPMKEQRLCVQVTEKYDSLWQAKDIEEFKQIFLDCLQCHREVYKSGRVLHRDISDTNLMIWRPEAAVKSEPQDEDAGISQVIANAINDKSTQESFGILNDFDMAVQLDEHGQVVGDRVHHRTGTLEFMACDLLNNRVDQEHWYRHDLESFFYVLVWAATHYDLKMKQRSGTATPKAFRLWTDPAHSEGEKIKFFFRKLFNQEEITQSVKPEFLGLWTERITPLHDMFQSALLYAANRKHDTIDLRTIDGQINFEKFMAAIGENPRSLIVEGALQRE